MLTENDQLGNTSHVVLDIDDCIYTEVQVLHLKGELLVAVEGILVGLVHVLEERFELFKELRKKMLLETMFKFTEEGLHALGLDGASC